MLKSTNSMKELESLAAEALKALLKQVPVIKFTDIKPQPPEAERGVDIFALRRAAERRLHTADAARAEIDRLLAALKDDWGRRFPPAEFARYLLALLGECRPGTEVRLPYDKRLLAARLGTRAEHLSRAFAALRAYGVTTHGAQVAIADPAQLATFAAVEAKMRKPANDPTPDQA